LAVRSGATLPAVLAFHPEGNVFRPTGRLESQPGHQQVNEAVGVGLPVDRALGCLASLVLAYAEVAMGPVRPLRLYPTRGGIR
jgi:hypothetical protein